MSDRESKTRSRALRSYVFATFQTRSPKELIEFLPILVARMVYEETPKVTIREVVQQFLDYLEIKGIPITPELLALKETPREGVTCIVPELEPKIHSDFLKGSLDLALGDPYFGAPSVDPRHLAKDSALRSLVGPLDDLISGPDYDGVVDLEEPLVKQTESGIVPLLKPMLEACWTKSVEWGFPKFFWKPFSFEGGRYYAIATWKIHGPDVDWNLTASYSGGIVYASDSAILVRHEDRPVHVSIDFDDFELRMPLFLQKSKFAGQFRKTNGTLFIWAIKWTPGTEVRCWLNECIGGKRSATGDLLRQKKLMVHF